MFRDNILPIMQVNATKDFNDAKSYILSAVESHEVSRELRDKNVPSRFLNSSSSTLFGFMGFEEGSDPVGDLVAYLEENITQKIQVRIGDLTLLSSVSLPSKSKMAKEPSLQLPWLNGISWPDALERGIPNFSSFIGKPNQGRSALGIQAKVKGTNQPQIVRDAEMEPVDFLTPIFSVAKRSA